MRLLPGTPQPLGARYDGRGTNFALFSAHAERVELCLFDAAGERELERIALRERSEDIWHGYLTEVGPGQCYGYRVHGPYQPSDGLRFNPNKLLLDPYARALSQRLVWDETHLAYRRDSERGDLSFDRRDNARFMPKAKVTAAHSSKQARRRKPLVRWEDTIIYEAHVKGLTRLREDVPPHWRGKFAALAAPAVIDHLRRLGVTTLELMPIHASIDEPFLIERGLTNYWGYNPLAYSVPDPRYADEDALAALRTTVARLHDAGIETVLDVVYNHTAEGDHLGPTLSFRGIDNISYYWLRPGEPRYYQNFTACGNALNLSHPRVRQMVIESLRHWVEACGIDGFRFDLATTLARAAGGFDAGAEFFAAIRQEPALASVKLMAEPWDVGPGGYRLGGFPREWSEWNDRFRRTLRRTWTGGDDQIRDLASRMTASSDLFNRRGRQPRASVNIVTVHDGFTLADLVSYRGKHNEANQEGNRDGADDNDSTDCGVEGPTGDAQILAQRRRLRRGLIACLLLAQGVPLLLAGDEVGNSQGGNNNAYCQDNPIGWVDWTRAGDPDEDMTSLIGELAALRRRFRQLTPPRWLDGRRADGSWDAIWLTPQGSEMTEQDWNFHGAHFLSYVLAPTQPGGAPLYIVINAAAQAIGVTLPAVPSTRGWMLLFDSVMNLRKGQTFIAGTSVEAPAAAVLAFAGMA